MTLAHVRLSKAIWARLDIEAGKNKGVVHSVSHPSPLAIPKVRAEKRHLGSSELIVRSCG